MIRLNGIGDDGSLTIRQRKTSDAHIVRLSAGTLAFVRGRLMVPDHKLLFPWPYSRPTFCSYWKEILKKAGLKIGRKEGLQKLRRTSVSHLERIAPGTGGVHLGHLTEGLARQHYIDGSIAYRQRPLPPAIEGTDDLPAW